jgi:hypothetical protein
VRSNAKDNYHRHHRYSSNNTNNILHEHGQSPRAPLHRTCEACPSSTLHTPLLLPTCRDQ